MPTTSIVLLRFKPDATAENIQEVCGRMLSLKDRCLHPKTQKPYIRSYIGGADNSIEGLQVNYSGADKPIEARRGICANICDGVHVEKNGFTHAFVIEFENNEDRDYCVNHDKVHQDIVGSLDAIVEKAQVVDFSHGIF